ncbi:MAG: cytochrome c biogenesis protein ResB [Planctomycetota bacterium]
MAFLILAQHGVDDEWRAGLVAGMAVLASLGAWGLWRARRTILDTLTSSRFAVALLTTLAGATALGTFVPQQATDEFLEKHFGLFATDWIDRLFLAEVFRSFWFGGLLGLLVLCLLLAIARRPFWRVAQWGFLLGHGGMAVVIIGAAIGSHYGVQGMMSLHKGERRDFMVPDEGGGDKGPRIQLDFVLRLDEFDVEKYPDELRFALYQAKRGVPQQLVQVIKLEQAKEWTALQKSDLSFRVHEYAPATGASRPVRHIITAEGALPFEVQVGQTYNVPGTTRSFKVVEFLPSFIYDIEKKRAASASNDPQNPALLVEEPGTTTGGAPHKQTLFAKMPGHGQKEGDLPLKYTCLNPSRVASVTLETRKRGESEASGEATLTAGGESGRCRLPGDLVLAFENRIGEPKSYRSQVSVLEGGQVVKTAAVAVNAPLSYGGYEFYQAGWKNDDLKYSGLRVVHDPGLGVVYAGMVLISLGVLFVFYVRPRVARPG